MKTIMISILFLCLSVSYAKDKKMKSVDKWKKIESLINKEIRTISALGKLGPRLKHRLIELYSEKLKIISDKDNDNFLNMTLGRGYKKESYFKRTRKYYRNIHNFSLKHLSQFPNYSYNGDIYYTMAVNSREYGKDNKTLKYLLRSLSMTPENSPTIYNTRVALAEYYYNKKNYSRAIQFYKKVVQNNNDEWKSKHEFNFSWCLFKERSYSNAISFLNKSILTGKNKRYIDVSEQVLESSNTFHIYANKIQDGIEFQLKHNKAPTKHLIKLTEKAAEHHGLKIAETIIQANLNHASKHAIKEKGEILSHQLKIYRQFNRNDLFYKTVKTIVSYDKKIKLKKELRKDIVTKVNALVSHLQQLNYKGHINKESRASDILNYFHFLQSLDPAKTIEYVYLQGETLRSVDNHEKAISKYAKALALTKKISKKKVDHKTMQRKIFDSFFVSLSKAKITKKKRTKLSIWSYKGHIKIWPRNETSRSIYSKLFNIYEQNKKYNHSHKLVDIYNKVYPEDIVKQRAMFSKLLDTHIKNKKHSLLASWINKLEGGYLSFDKVYITKSIEILATLLFGNLKKYEEKGMLTKSLEGNKSIFENDKYPKKIKAQAAINIASSYIQKTDTKKWKKWIIAANSLINKDEYSKHISLFSSMVEQAFLMGDLENSHIVSQVFFKRVCKDTNKTKTSLFKIWSQTGLLTKKLTWDKERKMGTQCLISPRIFANSIRNYKHLAYIEKDWKMLAHLAKSMKPKDQSVILDQALQDYWKYLDNKNRSQAKDIERNLLSKFKESKAYKSLLLQKVALKELRISMKKPILTYKQKKNFKEESFNKDLESSMQNLALMQKSIDDNLNILPNVMKVVYLKILSKKYEDFSKKLKNFTPKKMPKEYVIGFKGQMNSISKSIEVKGNQVLAQVKGFIIKEDLLILKGHDLFGKVAINKSFGHSLPAESFVATADLQ